MTKMLSNNQFRKIAFLAIATIVVFFYSALPNQSWAQPKQNSTSHPPLSSAAARQRALSQLDSLWRDIESWCSQKRDDKKILGMLSDRLRTNHAFLQQWEIGLNSKDAQIWQVLCTLSQRPYLIDSSQAILIYTSPQVSGKTKLWGTSGVLQIVPATLLDTVHEHDVILNKPDATGRAIGKVKPGEKYSYLSGTAGYSASMKQYVEDVYPDDGEGVNTYYAIVLNASQHRLGYISGDAAWLSYPVVRMQYVRGKWQISSITAQ